MSQLIFKKKTIVNLKSSKVDLESPEGMECVERIVKAPDVCFNVGHCDKSYVQIKASVGKNLERRYSEEALETIKELLDKLDRDELISQTIEHMNKIRSNKNVSLKSIFLDVTRENVEKGEFDPIDLIKRNYNLSPHISIVGYPYKDSKEDYETQLRAGFTANDGVDVTYTVPLTFAQMLVFRTIINSRVDTLEIAALEKR